MNNNHFFIYCTILRCLMGLEICAFFGGSQSSFSSNSLNLTNVFHPNILIQGISSLEDALQHEAIDVAVA
jgi:hypothetical protein